MGCDDLVAADLAIHLKQPVGETVQLPARVVATVDHGMVSADLARLPPAFENIEVELDLVRDDVQVAGRFEL